MDTIKIWNDNPSQRQIREIVERIENGELAILPSDSVYAIVCDALNPKAIAELCRIKRIDPDKNNLSILCPDLSMAAEYAVIDNSGFRLLKDNAPGPFTFLFKTSRALPKAFKGRKVVGIRIPDNIILQEILRELNHPLLCSSIEFDNSDEAREPELIAEKYERKGISFIVDGGEGGEDFSTIVDCTPADGPEIIREGKGRLLY